ncbi:MAG TPA: fibronectin type III domain-containing protein, partial [Pseudonocardiaceae bacterium]|nr:fibronectin type III domain-containing protein [Pseudonocardiaceae bacterium]
MHPRTGHNGQNNWRKRTPVIVGVLLCAVTAISLFTGAAGSVPGVRFELPGHWVYDSIVKAAFHIDGATTNIDAEVPVSADPGDQVVQGGTNGYVVGGTKITQFGQSTLSVDGSSTTPSSTEIPVGIEATGGPYLVYRNAGQVVRLGDSAVAIPTGGPVGVPVVSSDGTMWLYRTHSGQLCELTKDATTIGVCPGTVSGAHQGALTLVADHPEFVDASADTIRPVTDAGLGDAVPLGVRLSPNAVPAPQDVAGKVAILDK